MSRILSQVSKRSVNIIPGSKRSEHTDDHLQHDPSTSLPIASSSRRPSTRPTQGPSGPSGSPLRHGSSSLDTRPRTRYLPATTLHMSLDPMSGYVTDYPPPPRLPTTGGPGSSIRGNGGIVKKVRPYKGKKRKKFKHIMDVILYQISFWFFIVLTGALLVGSAWGLGEQAWRTGGQRRWNIVILVAAYVALGMSSIIHVWSRLLSIKKMLRTMPKPYMPTKHIDVPKRVADHVTTEYSRTAVIAHISQATKGRQEGWGRPGSKWENQHFRTYILNTLPTMTQALGCSTNAPPLSLQPLYDAAEQVGDNGAIRLFVNSYAKLIEKARYSGLEPDENDAVACDKIVDVVLLTLEMKRRRESGAVK